MRVQKSLLAVQRVRRRLERWRRTRTHVRAPIPPRIWAAAVALAREEGVYQIARALPISYGGLKQHLEAADRSAGADARSQFVEVRPMPVPVSHDWVIEIEGPHTAVRVRLPRIDLQDLVRLTRAIVGGDA